MKKKILLICKEKNSISFYHSLEKLSKNFLVDILFFMPHENDGSYFYNLFKKSNFVNKIYSTNSVIDKYFLAKKNLVKPNILFLKKIERKFKDFKNIRMQLNSIEYFSTYYHDRDIYHEVKNDHQLIFYEIYYKKILQILNLSKPVYIFDNDISEFRPIIYELSRQKNIPYIVGALSYYEDYCIPNFNLQAKPDYWLEKKVKKKGFVNQRNLLIKKEFKYKYIDIMLDYSSLTPYNVFREIYLFFKSFFFIHNISKTGYRFSLSAKFFKRRFLNLKIMIKKFIIKKFINFNDELESMNEKFVIFPLSYAPEGSTFTISPLFLNEKYCIELISKCLPVNYKLILKEHPVMLGQRSLSFYKEIQKLPNIIFLNPFSNYKIKNLISKSSAVATISGTAGFEAIMLKKPSILFARPLYSVLEGCYSFENVDNFKKDLNIILNKKKIQSYSSLKNYIDLVKKFGKKVDTTVLNSINKFPKEIIEKNVDNFIAVFKIGIELNKNIKKHEK